ncbi:MAG: cupin domain-containing protein [Spongiibacteraceae bacterium]
MTSTEYYFREGCFITELSNRADDPDVSIAQARVEPGKTTRWHRLQHTTERYVILSGTGIVEVGDEKPRSVHKGDVVFIPALCAQRIHNNGSDDLIFLAICAPRFLPENYEDLEEKP